MTIKVSVLEGDLAMFSALGFPLATSLYPATTKLSENR